MRIVRDDLTETQVIAPLQETVVDNREESVNNENIEVVTDGSRYQMETETGNINRPRSETSQDDDGSHEKRPMRNRDEELPMRSREGVDTPRNEVQQAVPPAVPLRRSTRLLLPVT